MGRVLRARLLGRFSVQVEGGRPAGPWERPAARRLVQILLLRPAHACRREVLADLLYPNLDPAGAARAVSKALAMARSAFGPDRDSVLGADASGIWLHDALTVETDLDRLHRSLRAAMAAEPGPEQDRELERLLSVEGEVVAEDPYADWAITARDAYRDLRHEARLVLARGRASGKVGARTAQLIEAWRACLVDNPTQEEAAAGLMRAYLSVGQRDLAIRTFHRCRTALHDELEVEPGPELLGLHEQARTWALATVPVSPGRTAGLGSPRRPALHGRGPLVTRLLRLLRREDPPSVLLTGPPGIGKSRLLEALAVGLSERGWTVLSAAATPDDLRAPLSMLRLLLPSLLEHHRGPMAPSLRRLIHADPDGDGATPLTDGRRLVLDVRRLLDALAAEAPLALLLDDAHWWDRGTERLMAELAEPRGATRWVMVVAARSGEPRARMPGFPRGVVRCELPPLSQAATEAVVGDAARGARLPRALRSAIATLSAGNPFFAVELARQATTEPLAEGRAPHPSRVPARIVDLLQARLRRCSGVARRVLPLAALAGELASYELLIELGRVMVPPRSAGEVVGAVDELVAAELLVEKSAGVGLVHPLLRDAALANLNPVHRGALHALIAEALEGLGPGHGGMWQEAAARHRLSAFESARLREMAAAAARSGFAAGHRARELLAREAAVELLQGARSAFEVLSGGERTAMRSAATAAAAELGDCLLDGDDDRGAEAAYLWGLELADSDAERARLWSALGGIAYRHGDMAAAALAYERGLATLSGADRAAEARLLSDLGWARQRQGRFEDALPLFERALPALEAAGDDAYLAWTLDRLAIALVAAGQPSRALDASTSAFQAASRAGMRAQLAALHIHRADVLEAVDRLPDALAQSREAARISAESGDRYVQAVAHWESADILASMGAVEEALGERDAELPILTELGNARNLAGNQLHRARLLARLRRPAEARQAMDSARQAARLAADPELSRRIDEGLSEVEQALCSAVAGASAIMASAVLSSEPGP
jgi:DNA-binding SARP family transcriptional activator/tetratricopeptide (TPR) repeat protein